MKRIPSLLSIGWWLTVPFLGLVTYYAWIDREALGIGNAFTEVTLLEKIATVAFVIGLIAWRVTPSRLLESGWGENAQNDYREKMEKELKKHGI